MLQVADVAATAQFYVEHFRFVPLFEADWYVHLQSRDDEAVNLAILRYDHDTVPEVARKRSQGVILNFEVEDPDAVKPDDWDDDEDGDWEAPVVPNPLCAKAPGCGEWVRPKKHNPDYKGKWYPPMIDNPEYKGPWAPRKIPNPKHYKDDAPLANVGSVGAVAMEIWTMSKGLVVDNVLVAADDVAAKELQDTQWRPKYDALKAVKDETDAEEAKRAEEAVSPGRGFKGMVVDAVSGVASVAPGALGDKLNDFATHLENPDNTPTFYAFCVGVALVVTLLFTAVADLFAGSGEDAKKSAAK